MSHRRFRQRLDKRRHYFHIFNEHLDIFAWRARGCGDEDIVGPQHGSQAGTCIWCQ